MTRMCIPGHGDPYLVSLCISHAVHLVLHYEVMSVYKYVFVGTQVHQNCHGLHIHHKSQLYNTVTAAMDMLGVYSWQDIAKKH